MNRILPYTIAFTVLFLSHYLADAQNVAINTTGDTPDASAILDVKSTTAGMLIPRMTTMQRSTIPSPAQGLLVFDNQTSSFWFYKGITWTEIAAGGSPTNYWTASGANIFNNNAGNVGIGINTPASALHIKRDNEALRIQGALPYIGFYNNDGGYKGFVWQGPANSLSLGTSVGNATGRIEFYNNGTLNTYIANTGSVEILGTSPSLSLNQNGIRSANFRASGNDLEIAARKLQSGTPGNIIFQLDEFSQFGNFEAGNIGINTNNPVNKLQIGYAPGFSGNQLAIGTGTKGMSFFQNATTSHWFSSTNFALMSNGGVGNVGIGTSTPTAKLQIAAGDLKIEAGNLQLDNGKVVTPSTGIYNMIPLCYGKVVVNRISSVYSLTVTGTPNVSVVRNQQGVYRIFCAGIVASSIIIITPNSPNQFRPKHASAQFITNGEIEVLTIDLRDLIDPPQFYVGDDSDFYFVIYK